MQKRTDKKAVRKDVGESSKKLVLPLTYYKMADKQLKDKAISFKGSDYVQVKDRVLYLADNYDGRYEIDQDYQYFEQSKTRVVKTTLTIWDEKHEKSCKYV
jgi:hypothetical protein